MAHFAEIDATNTVVRVIVVDNNELLNENNVEIEALGCEYLTNLLGGTWVQTSYNANFRGKFAGTGDTYDTSKDLFIPKKLFPSWTLGTDNLTWIPPVPMPIDKKVYDWDEDSGLWVEAIPNVLVND
jgi:hypothetical protein